jgi:helix-turn-helix protein
VKSAAYIECIPATESQLSKKSHCETKGDMQQCGDTQIDKRIESSYRFQPLSIISDTPNGDRNNPKIKYADLEEDRNVNKKKIFAKQELQMKFRNFNITFKRHQQCKFSSKLFNLTY